MERRLLPYNTKKEENTKIQHAIKDVRGKYITMGDFSHGHITMETSRGEDQHFTGYRRASLLNSC